MTGFGFRVYRMMSENRIYFYVVILFIVCACVWVRDVIISTLIQIPHTILFASLYLKATILNDIFKLIENKQTNKINKWKLKLFNLEIILLHSLNIESLSKGCKLHQLIIRWSFCIKWKLFLQACTLMLYFIFLQSHTAVSATRALIKLISYFLS